MPVAALTRVHLATASLLALNACGILGPGASAPVNASDLPNAGLARLAGLTRITFVWETRPTCKLETGTGDALPQTWEPQPTNLLAGQVLDVTGMTIHKRDDVGKVQWLAVAVKQGAET